MKEHARFYTIAAIVLFLLGLLITGGNIFGSLIFVALTYFCIWLEIKYDNRNARISESAAVSGNSKVSGNAEVSGNAKIE